MNLAKKMVTRFRYGTRINNLHNIYEMTESPIIKLKVDKNRTHVAAQHRLLESLICINKGLSIYQVRNRLSIGDDVTLMDANWKQFGELEVVLEIT